MTILVAVTSKSPIKINATKKLCDMLNTLSTEEDYKFVDTLPFETEVKFDTPEQPMNMQINLAAASRSSTLFSNIIRNNVELKSVSSFKMLIVSFENGIENRVENGTDVYYDVCKMHTCFAKCKFDYVNNLPVYDTTRKLTRISSFGIAIDNNLMQIYLEKFALDDNLTFGKFLSKYYGVQHDNWMSDSRFGGIDRSEQISDCINKYVMLKFTDIIPNYPRPHVMFKDISSVLAKPQLLNIMFNSLERLIRNNFNIDEIDFFAGLDARGFYFAPHLAHIFNKGFIPIRKANKLPPVGSYPVRTVEYTTEYSSDVFGLIERPEYLCKTGEQRKNVVCLDDLLATGGSLIGSVKLLREIGMNVLGCVTLYHVPELHTDVTRLFENENVKSYVLIDELANTTECTKLVYKLPSTILNKTNDSISQFDRVCTMTNEEWLEDSTAKIDDLSTELKSVRFVYTEKDSKLAENIISSLGSLIGTDSASIISCSKATIVNGEFSNGESRVKIETSVRNSHVIVICQTRTGHINSDFMELKMILDACNRSGAKKTTVVLPYYPYARSDKKDDPRCPIGAAVIANDLVNHGVENVISLDLHAGQIQGYISHGFQNLYIRNYACDYIYNNYLKFYPRSEWNNLFVLIAPDAGSAKAIKSYSTILGINNVIMDKQRDYSRPGTVVGSRYTGTTDLFAGKTAIVIDDMADTMGTVCAASNELVSDGAKNVIVIVTHGVLSGGAIDRINKTESIVEVVVSNTLPQDENMLKCPKLRILNCGELLARCIDGILTGRSISRLFEKKTLPLE